MIERYKDGRKLTDAEVIEVLRLEVNAVEKRFCEVVTQIEQIKRELGLCLKCWKKKNSRTVYTQTNPNPWKKTGYGSSL